MTTVIFFKFWLLHCWEEIKKGLEIWWKNIRQELVSSLFPGLLTVASLPAVKYAPRLFRGTLTDFRGILPLHLLSFSMLVCKGGGNQKLTVDKDEWNANTWSFVCSRKSDPKNLLFENLIFWGMRSSCIFHNRLETEEFQRKLGVGFKEWGFIWEWNLFGVFIVHSFVDEYTKG